MYCKEHIAEYKTESELRSLVLHENLHVALKQLPRGKDMFDENRTLANIAADMVVNNIIEDIKGNITGSSERIVELPDGAVYDPMFQHWSMREVYNYLKKNCKGGKKGKTGAWGTGADVLETLAAEGHDLPARVLDWRQLSKLKSTYTDALQEHIHPETGRVHTS